MFPTAVQANKKGFSVSYQIDYAELNFGEKREELGNGGFGVVYKAYYHFRPAAIKQLHMENLSPEAEEEFNKEATIMAQLHHPNIVHFYGYCTIPKCLVMEYMPKGSLFHVLHSKREPLDWNIRIRIATDIASGLAFLHSKDILHRDIKSLNVLLDAQANAKLTDFGLSKVKNETRSKSMAGKTKQDVGTTQWMAPELFNPEGEPISTCKSDVYSLGVTFWELAAYKIPYANRHPATIPYLVVQGKREDIPADCPKEFAELIKKCWAGNPDERPSASDIATLLISDNQTLKTTPSKASTFESSEYQLTSQPITPLYKGNLSSSTADLNPQVSPVSSAASPKLSHLRRCSEKLNLTDKKEEKERIEYVLKSLRTFFREGRSKGERTENFGTYNEYLKQVHKDAELAYDAEQNKHMLYVNDNLLDNQAAAKELSKILESLMITTNVSVATLVKSNQSEQKNPPMLSQFEQIVKSIPFGTSTFLKFVAEGEQDNAEAMLKTDPALALIPGDVTDLSKRTFTNITGFQYAVWALDWHMWTMIRKYLPTEAAREQTEGFEKGSWVKQHGVSAQYILECLVKALQTTIDLYNAEKYRERATAWIQQVGGVQLILPAHVVNEYCHPTRSFDPIPNFRENILLPRSRKIAIEERFISGKIDARDWFTAVYNGGKLGDKFACGRGSLRVAHGTGAHPRVGTWSLEQMIGDHISVRELTNIRTTQREELIAKLKPVATTANSPAVTFATANPLEQKNPPMLTQFNLVTKPTQVVNVGDLQSFLKLVAEGEQDKAEDLLKANPVLALVPGDVTDLSKRTFTNITGFQYAVWALDWHMWTMIRKYLPTEAAREQAEGFETGSWVKQHGVSAQHILESLVKALQTTIDLCSRKKYSEADTAWVKRVGGAQLILPAHVVNEYCHPERPFDPCPNFREIAPLPRSRKSSKNEWFTALGGVFAWSRGSGPEGDPSSETPYYYRQYGMRMGPSGRDIQKMDCDAVRELTSTRTAQREELITELKVRNVQRKAV